MKKSTLFVVALLVVVFVVSCEALIGSFTASINGVTWKAGFSGALKNGSSQYVITATKDTTSIVITIPGTAQGTYTINPNDTTVEALIYTPSSNNSSVNYISTQGTVSLSSVNQNRLTGTFNVWAKNTVTTTDSIQINGEFSNILSN